MPVLGRYGLTHGILAWARCRLWCEQHEVTMLAPFWLKLRIGPYLRRERDKRNYFLLFHRGPALGGLRRLVILAHAKRIGIKTEWPTPPLGSEPAILCFENAVADNEKKSFDQVVGHASFLRRELLAITRPAYHPRVSSVPFIAIHVRMGDFGPVAADTASLLKQNNTRLPIDWYADRLDTLRCALDQNVRAIVFSDGSDDELAVLLRRTGVSRAPRQQSVTDLLEMGYGIALIASGSGFSLWGAFLGSVPRISYPGRSSVPIDADPTRDIESGVGETYDPAFVRNVLARIEQ